MKNYNFEKAKELILENKENLKEVSLGMHEDLFWTAETIWEDGEFTIELNDKTEISGIQGSSWATPTLQLIFKNDTEEMIECSIGDNEKDTPAFFSLGVLSQPVQNNITPLTK